MQLPPEIASRFNELGISFEVEPWIWIHTLDPIRERTKTVSRIAAHVPTATGGVLWTQDQPSPQGHNGFGPEWENHYYEAVGILRYFNHDGLRFTATPDNLPGKPPPWEAVAIGSSDPSIIAALWWQRAWRPTPQGVAPTLIAELRWWPGLIGAQPFFRPTTEVGKTISPKDLRAAERARALLYGLHPYLAGGRPAEWPDEPTFRARVEPVVQSLRNRRGKATRDNAAEELHISSEYLKGLTHDLTGLSWPEFVKTVP